MCHLHKKRERGGEILLALVNNKPGCYYNQITTVYKTINILKCAFFLYIRPYRWKWAGCLAFFYWRMRTSFSISLVHAQGALLSHWRMRSLMPAPLANMTVVFFSFLLLFYLLLQKIIKYCAQTINLFLVNKCK